MRVYELAKKLGLSSKELMGILERKGYPVKNHMSGLDNSIVEVVENIVKGEEKKPVAKKKSKPVISKPVETPSKPRKKPAVTGEKKKPRKKEAPSLPKSITISEALTVREFAQLLHIPAAMLMERLMKSGHFITINQLVEEKICQEIAESFGVEVVTTGEPGLSDEQTGKVDGTLIPRAPVVTLMGHVDHGKTSLLDCIRESRLVAKEAGGITQHMGAYRVTFPDGSAIVFLDTPGHEAFTAMRARGARVTDIVVLVVAADDGIMPQTIEAINHAKAAEVPIIVAINKIDKPNSNPDKVAKDLMKHQLIPEKWGGDIITVEVSAKEKTNLGELLEMIQLQAEMLELQTNPNQPAVGRILEAKLDRTRGAVATVLVQHGTLRVGDPFICGFYYGKTRALINDLGQMVKVAGPSTPVSVLGISGTPNPGELFKVVSSEKKVRQLAEQRKLDHDDSMIPRTPRVTLEDLYSQIQQEKLKEFNIVLKADVQGSIEAITNSLSQLKVESVELKIIHSGVGLVNTSDVLLASASNAVIIGFGIKIEGSTKKLAETENVEIRTYDVIYNLLDDMKRALYGMIEPESVDDYQGKAEVLAIFKVPKIGIVAGCRVKDGKIARNNETRIIRGDQTIYSGKISSLKRFKDDVKEVASGYECGIGVEGFTEFEEGDIIEAYIVKQKKVSDTPDG